MDYQNNGQYPTPQPQNTSNGMAIAALVCGIAGIVFFWTYIALLASIAAIVLGVISRKSLPAGKTGMATAGLVLGIVGISLGILFIICAVCTLGALGSIWGSGFDFSDYGF